MRRLDDSNAASTAVSDLTAAPRRATPEGRDGRILRSFWAAGFESACHVNSGRTRLDMIGLTQHDRYIDEDYSMLKAFNIAVVRDATRWHLVDQGPGRYDFSSLAPMVRAAARHGVQVIWVLCHYGWPEGVDLLSAQFIERFTSYSTAVAQFIAEHTDEPPLYTPVNEISYFAFAAGSEAIMYPFYTGRGHEVKRQMVRAAIASMDAIRGVDPRARFVHCEPLIHIVAPLGSPELADAATARRNAQFETFDLLGGLLEPELGGAPRYLDVLGWNFYASNEWDYWGGKLLWHVKPRDPRWLPLHQLLLEVYRRYDRPTMISETSHVGHGRGEWILEIASEVLEAQRLGAPLEGVCVYPIIDRPDWDCGDHWHKSGLWDLVRTKEGRLRRVLCTSYADDFCRAQQLLRSRGLVQAEPRREPSHPGKRGFPA